MATRTIEIDDTLQERVDGACDEVKAELFQYLDQSEPSSCPDLNDLDDSGTIHEIVDGSVPISTYEIRCLWFLYDSDLENAYENAGLGSNPRENDGMAAIYCYIYEQVNEWWSDNAGDLFDAWQSAQEAKENIEGELEILLPDDVSTVEVKRDDSDDYSLTVKVGNSAELALTIDQASDLVDYLSDWDRDKDHSIETVYATIQHCQKEATADNA